MKTVASILMIIIFFIVTVVVMGTFGDWMGKSLGRPLGGLIVIISFIIINKHLIKQDG